MVRVPEGETDSQVRPPLWPDALTENRVRLPALTAREFLRVVELPAVAENDNEAGETVIHPPSWAIDMEVQIGLATRAANVSTTR